MNAMVDRIGVGSVNANGHDIHYVDNGAGWRYATLLDKEPETIEWIDSFAPGDSFWDIGANVGIYSTYAGVRGIPTMAFEPHFANYHQLCQNIGLNGLQDHVMPLCLAFSDSKAVGEMHLASTDFGTSMSNFGAALDFRGQPFTPAFRQGMIGYDIDSFVADFGIEIPAHIKIDVDGIELPIVQGARRTLADPRVKSVSIELIESDEAQVSAVTAILEEAGFRFLHKKQNIAFSTAETMDVLNYLYARDSHLPALARAAETRLAAAAAYAADPQRIVERIAAQIVTRIGEAAIDPDPTANIFMTDMLPDDLYAELLARLPADEVLDPIVHPDAVAPDGRITRRLLDLTAQTIERIDETDRAFWATMIDVFTAPALTAALIEKFRPALTARFGHAIPDLVAVPVLYRDYPGYRIGIHPDMPGKIATMQFYLPADERQRHLGTEFHRRTDTGFEHLKTNAFLPNSAYAFVRTDESWHSVSELAADESVRNTLALTFYIRGQEYRSDMMMDGAAEAPAVHSDAEFAEALRNIAATFTCPGDIATLFRAGAIGVAIGIGDGDIAGDLLDRSQANCLYAVDEWKGGIDSYMAAVRRLNPQRDRNVLLRMDQADALGMFSDSSLDFVFVDPAAGFDPDNGRTLADWYTKLRPVGIIGGVGYGTAWPDMTVAVQILAEACDLELHIIACRDDAGEPTGAAWFAMKP